MQTTTTPAAKALLIIRTVADAIREAGSIPSGHLYAMLMTYGCSLSQYESIIGILVESGRVEKRGDLLVWSN